ncbi:hypothetical protein GF327_06435 [Candidatus Woesearchaeota archaeon]|nr:hypothetical protein [Candidatus Woesearchaeota archaeon]
MIKTYILKVEFKGMNPDKLQELEDEIEKEIFESARKTKGQHNSYPVVMEVK